MRVAQMPHIYQEKRREGDRVTVRQVYERRYPKDVVPILGRRFIHKWPIQVTKAQAGDDPTVPTEYKRRVEEARAGMAANQERYIHYPDPAFGGFVGRRLTKVKQSKRFVAGIEVPMDFDLAAHLRQTVRAEKSAITTTVDSEEMITLWSAERTQEGNPPKNKAIAARRMKMQKMFDWLRANRGFTGGSNMAAVTPDDLQAYKEYVIPLGIAFDHMAEIVALFGFADANNKFRSLPGGNPAEKLRVPRKRKGVPRKPFTPDEARKILVSARQSDDPVIRWGQWLGAFSGTITEEIFGATKAEFYKDGDVWVWDFTTRAGLKTAYRPRGIPVHPSLIREGLINWVQAQPNGPLFHVTPTKASAMLMRHIRSLGVVNTIDPETGKVLVHKVHYSWRHGFCSQLEDLTTADRARYLSGHAAKDVHARNYLHHELPKLAAAINGLDDPTVEQRP